MEVKRMYKEGDYVHYANSGLCKVEKVTTLDISGADKDRLYYYLKPVDDWKSTIFVPVDTRVAMRPAMTRKEADDLIDSIPDIQILWISDEKKREQAYRAKLQSMDAKDWVMIIKTLNKRKRDRMVRGRKTTSTDERYLKSAEDRLFSELALALGRNKDDMEEYIEKRLFA